MATSNPLTQQYGYLKGWQWAALTGSLLAVYLYVHKRSADAAAAAQSTDQQAGQGTDAAGNPIPGTQVLAPIIIQQGNTSTPVPSPKPPAPAPKPVPKKQPAPAQKVNAGNYPATIAANSALGKSLVQVGTIQNGRYVGKNSSSGAPVFALIDTAFGPRTSFVQGFNISKLPNGTKIFTLPQFAKLFK